MKRKAPSVSSKDSKSKSRRKSRSKSPRRRRRRTRSKSPYSPDRRRPRYESRDPRNRGNRRSRSRDRPRSPVRNRDRSREPRSRRGPVSPPQSQAAVSGFMQTQQMYNPGYNAYPQDIHFVQQQNQQYPNYDYTMQTQVPPTFNAYNQPPPVMQPIPPGEKNIRCILSIQ